MTQSQSTMKTMIKVFNLTALAVVGAIAFPGDMVIPCVSRALFVNNVRFTFLCSSIFLLFVIISFSY